MYRRWFVLVAPCLAATLLSAQTYSFTTIDYPGATQTNPNAINKQKMIVGTYRDANSVLHGFADFNGSFVSIDAPNAVFTSANGINNKGVIVGNFGGQSGNHGFILHDGQFTQVDVPGAQSTQLMDINDQGVIGGTYVDGNGSIRSFLRFGPNHYRAVEFPGSSYTALNAVNNRLELTGQMSPPFISAFLFAGQQWTNFYFPGAFTTTGRGINDNTQVVGIFNPQDPTAPQEGFLRNSDGTFQEIDFPGSVGGYAGGINNDGVIVGGYGDSAGGAHGYMATPQP